MYGLLGKPSPPSGIYLAMFLEVTGLCPILIHTLITAGNTADIGHGVVFMAKPTIPIVCEGTATPWYGTYLTIGVLSCQLAIANETYPMAHCLPIHDCHPHPAVWLPSRWYTLVQVNVRILKLIRRCTLYQCVCARSAHTSHRSVSPHTGWTNPGSSSLSSATMPSAGARRSCSAAARRLLKYCFGCVHSLHVCWSEPATKPCPMPPRWCSTARTTSSVLGSLGPQYIS